MTKYGPVQDGPHAVHRRRRFPHGQAVGSSSRSSRAGCPSAWSWTPLTRDDFRRILTEPKNALLKQYAALLATEGVTLDFTDDARGRPSREIAER